MTRLLLALALTLAACAPQVETGTPTPVVVIRVDNQRWQEIAFYFQDARGRHKLADVTRMSQQTFVVPRNLLPDGCLVVVAHTAQQGDIAGDKVCQVKAKVSVQLTDKRLWANPW